MRLLRRSLVEGLVTGKCDISGGDNSFRHCTDACQKHSKMCKALIHFAAALNLTSVPLLAPMRSHGAPMRDHTPLCGRALGTALGTPPLRALGESRCGRRRSALRQATERGATEDGARCDRRRSGARQETERAATDDGVERAATEDGAR